jgi:hypothetical protein
MRKELTRVAQGAHRAPESYKPHYIRNSSNDRERATERHRQHSATENKNSERATERERAQENRRIFQENRRIFQGLHGLIRVIALLPFLGRGGRHSSHIGTRRGLKRRRRRRRRRRRGLSLGREKQRRSV